MIPGEPQDPQLMDAIQQCRDCHAICICAGRHYMQTGGSDDRFILLMQDVAAMCNMTAEALLRGSDFEGRITGLCADVCERCAAECERHAGDPVVKACCDACQRATAACRHVSGMVSALG